MTGRRANSHNQLTHLVDWQLEGPDVLQVPSSAQITAQGHILDGSMDSDRPSAAMSGALEIKWLGDDLIVV
ncbi:unnamed protein product [Lota lota]